MSVEATVAYLNFLIQLRRQTAERAAAVSLTAFRRGTPFTAEEKAVIDLCFEKLQSFDELIPRQAAIVAQGQRQQEESQRDRDRQQREARRKAREQAKQERARWVAEQAEAKRLKKRPVEKEQRPRLQPKGVWLNRTVSPREDDVTVPVAEVEEVTGPEHGYYLESQIEHQARTLIAWRYKSLNARHYSRRYEGYQRAM